MKFFHGTSASSLDSILERGLQPAQETVWATPGKTGPHPRMVYLAKARFHAYFFALRAAIHHKSDRFTILQVDIKNPFKLYPDENVIVQLKKGSPFYTTTEAKDAQKKIESSRHLLIKSLVELKICCHFGSIPPTQISVYRSAPLDQNPLFWLVNETGTMAEFDAKLHSWLAYRTKRTLDDDDNFIGDRLKRVSGSYELTNTGRFDPNLRFHWTAA